MNIHMKQKWEYFEFAIELEKTNGPQREKGKKGIYSQYFNHFTQVDLSRLILPIHVS